MFYNDMMGDVEELYIRETPNWLDTFHTFWWAVVTLTVGYGDVSQLLT